MPEDESDPRPSVNQEKEIKEPEERDGLSDGSLRTEERIRAGNTSNTCSPVSVLNVMAPPAAHREPVGFIFPHSDV